MNGSQSGDWSRLDAALDRVLDLPPLQRDAAVDALAAGDVALAAELRTLLPHLGRDSSALDRPALQWLQAEGETDHALAPGMRLGVYRIEALIGRGGMGEVYRAQRVDGQFEQQVAIKLVRTDSAAMTTRFQVERQILARLVHPGIAALHDGGVTPDGRPYMVMELVRGQPLLDWCRDRRLDLPARLQLFLGVCDAVAHAHRHLVVHRDLKPANVLVTADGRSQLLDFGVARLLDTPAGDQTRELLLTPGYAAPEQLSGGALTTATDVYALGLILLELLTDRPAFDVQQLSLAAALQWRVRNPPSRPSRIAAGLPAAPVPARLLRGDLDAIVAKALRDEPEQRYDGVAHLMTEVQRHLRHEPVQARRGSTAYVLGRALRRRRAWAVGAALALVTAVVGLAAVLWQADLAHHEARREMLVKDYLLQMFRASDPRVAADKPRGQISARELLDTTSAHIEQQFASEPELQVELLGTVAGIYRELHENQRYQALAARRLAVAQQHPGRFPAVEIEALLDQASDAGEAGRVGQAQALLRQADAKLHAADLDDSALRARWWLTRGQTMAPDLKLSDAREGALTAAIRRYEKVAPRNPGRVTAVSDLGLSHFMRGDAPGAITLYTKALALDDTVDGRDDGEMQVIYGNLGTAHMNLGEFALADAAYRHAAEIARRTYGEQRSNYWYPAAFHARLVHLGGDRARADVMFEALLPLLPPLGSDVDAMQAVETYGACLAAEGRPVAALPWLEAAERLYRLRRHADNDLRRLRLVLGDSYDQLGRSADARRALKAAADEFSTTEHADRQTAMAARERWGRFLLAQGETDAARRQFESVVVEDHERHLAHTALAQAGLGGVALAEGHAAQALTLTADAWQRWQGVRGFRDVRMGPLIRRSHARALLAAGEVDAALAMAQAALDESRAYDAPDATSIAEAQALLRLAGAGHAPH